MTRSSTWWALLPLVACVPLACNNESSGNNATTTTASTTASAAPSVAPSASVAFKPRPMYGRHAGLASGLFRSAHDLSDLTDAEKDGLDKLETELKTDDEGVKTAMRTFRTDLATGIKAGKIDTAKMTADDGVVDKAVADHKEKEGEDLGKLHDLLTPAQRTELVNSTKAKMAEHETRMTTWMHAKEADGGPQDWTKKRLEKLTAELGLDAGQQTKVQALLGKSAEPPSANTMQQRWDDMKKRHDALLTSFEGDTFDPKKADLTILPGKTAHDPMDHMVTFYSQLLPILKPDQQAKLAMTVERPFGGFGPNPQMEGRMRGPSDDIAFPFSEPQDMPPGPPSMRPSPP